MQGFIDIQTPPTPHSFGACEVYLAQVVFPIQIETHMNDVSLANTTNKRKRSISAPLELAHKRHKKISNEERYFLRRVQAPQAPTPCQPASQPDGFIILEQKARTRSCLPQYYNPTEPGCVNCCVCGRKALIVGQMIQCQTNCPLNGISLARFQALGDAHYLSKSRAAPGVPQRRVCAGCNKSVYLHYDGDQETGFLKLVEEKPVSAFISKIRTTAWKRCRAHPRLLDKTLPIDV